MLLYSAKAMYPGNIKKYCIVSLLVTGVLVSLAAAINAQETKPDQINFLRKSGRPIKITSPDGSDLKALDKPLKGKRIVLLGEWTHGRERSTC